MERSSHHTFHPVHPPPPLPHGHATNTANGDLFNKGRGAGLSNRKATFDSDDPWSQSSRVPVLTECLRAWLRQRSSQNPLVHQRPGKKTLKAAAFNCGKIEGWQFGLTYTASHCPCRSLNALYFFFYRFSVTVEIWGETSVDREFPLIATGENSYMQSVSIKRLDGLVHAKSARGQRRKGCHVSWYLVQKYPIFGSGGGNSDSPWGTFLTPLEEAVPMGPACTNALPNGHSTARTILLKKLIFAATRNSATPFRLKSSRL